MANRSKDTDEVDRYCDVVGFNRIAHMPDIDAIRRSRLKKKTLFEMDTDEEVQMVAISTLALHSISGTAPIHWRPRRWKTAISLSFWGSIDVL